MKTTYQLNPSTLSLQAEKWILKGMFELNYFDDCVGSEGEWTSPNLAASLGLPPEIEDDKEINGREETRRLLQARFQQIRAISPTLTATSLQIGYKNIAYLSSLFDFSPVEQQVLQFALHLQAEHYFGKWLCELPKMNLNESCQFLAKLLNFPVKEVQSALKKQGKLMSYGLIQRHFSADQVDEYLQWGDTLDVDEMTTQEINADHLLARCAMTTPKAKLAWQQFDYVDEMRAKIYNYLKNAAKIHKKGVNVLIYGEPGTGKTELASLVVEQLGLDSYTLAYMDQDGDVISGKRRLENCRLAQKLLGDSQSVLIFDEIEDVFASGLFEQSAAQSHKAWTNNLLESNAVPMIWLSNDVSMMDNAFLRRFDLIFEMPDLPVQSKVALIRERVGNRLSENQIQHFAEVKNLTPAILDRGLMVATSLQMENDGSNLADLALSIFNETLKAQGFAKISPPVDHKVSYNLDFVNSNSDIRKISDGLKRHKCGRICCYGPAGTGKTAWANWLAKELEMPILVKQGSDLLDAYVGNTEKNIARAFEEATSQEKVLVFDEVDSFLFARESGQRSWEHSCVNEMLTQIEKFEGLLIVSTNLMDNLDPAALRRFDIKLHFGYLNVEQRQKLAIEQAEKLGLSAPNEAENRWLEKLNLLTLGDFAAVARRHRFSPFDSTQEWLEALNDECKLKSGGEKRGIGFLN